MWKQMQDFEEKFKELCEDICSFHGHKWSEWEDGTSLDGKHKYVHRTCQRCGQFDNK